ncbi:MAG: glycosyltransferase family 2 protein [Oculatellaceae cyanobacterium bins.114]|nr:glycosyltransferase family 2 protein [Oculatellaceae cyanobacterium bins.114]
MPKISVCIPTCNRSQLLHYAVESALGQTETDVEIIVCDDGSTDNTPDLMATLIANHPDRTIRYIRHPQNIGKSNNMRSGFEAATGDYFIKFDDDDRLTPTFLAETGAILDQHPNIDLVGTDHWIIDINNVRDTAATDANSQKWGRAHLPGGVIQNLVEVTFIDQSLQIGATLFRRRVLQEVNYMRPNIQNCEDNDLLVRLAIAGKQAYYLPKRLMEYRVHAGQQGIDRATRYLKDKLTYLENFKFETEPLERVRQMRLRETQLLLGLRLIETGETQQGRQFALAGQSASRGKAWVGLSLSLLPLGLRKQAFQRLRQIK